MMEMNVTYPPLTKELQQAYDYLRKRYEGTYLKVGTEEDQDKAPGSKKIKMLEAFMKLNGVTLTDRLYQEFLNKKAAHGFWISQGTIGKDSMRVMVCSECGRLGLFDIDVPGIEMAVAHTMEEITFYLDQIIEHRKTLN